MTSCRSLVSRSARGRRRCGSRNVSIARTSPRAPRTCCWKRTCGWRASMCAPCARSVCRSSWRVPWPRRPPAVGEQLSILRLIAQASVPVQIVIGILLLASLGSWAIIFRKRRVIGRARREADRFEGRFWSGDDLAQLYRAIESRGGATGMAGIFEFGFREFARQRQRARRGEPLLHGSRGAQRVAQLKEIDRLDQSLAPLATLRRPRPCGRRFGA